MRRVNFLQIAVFLLSTQLLCCKEDPVSQPHSGTRPLFESTAATPVVCSNAGNPVDLISAFTISRQDSTSMNYTFTNHSSGASSYRLDFGDGSPLFAGSTFTTKTHTFAGPGVYVATLFAVRGDGMKCSEKKIIIDPSRSGG